MKTNQFNYKKIITFIIITYTISWLIWLPNVISDNFNLSLGHSKLLHLTGGLGPLLGALVTTVIYYKKKGLKEYFKQRYLKLPELKWILTAVLIPSSFFLITFLIIRTVSGEWTELTLIGINSNIPFRNQFLIWLSWLLFYGIGEESGWRGFLFQELKKKFNFRTAVLYTSIIWAFWHLPIFLYDKNFQSMGLTAVIGWLIGLIFGSFILGWLTINAEWNIWPAILWHATFNFFTAGDKINSVYPALISMMVIIYGLWLSRKYEFEGRRKMITNKMKAAVRKKYGTPDTIEIKEIEVPKPKKDELLIKVYAATVNRTDCAVLTGRPYIMRLFTGLFNPKLPITGTDFAGQIESVGQNVSSFKVGDMVFGFNDNGLASHAQYMTISEDKAVSLIPEKFSYEEAAASLEGVHYAYNFIKKVKINKGDHILINGATGAIGSALLQFSKYYGAYVTAVGNSKNIELMKSLGADKVIDYQQEDFTEENKKYKYIFDAVGKSSYTKCRSMLETNGVYISSELGSRGQNLLLSLITPVLGGKKVIFPVPTDINASIDFIKKLIEEDEFKAVIDRKYTLNKIDKAYSYVLTGQKTGNVIITI